MNQKYIVQLSEAERYQLKQVISSGTTPARTIRRANILLKSDSSEGGARWTYQLIMDAFEVSNVTISDIRKAYLEGGLEKVLNRKKPEREYPRCLDGKGEAHLIALACSEPPDSHERWSLRLLRDRLIQLQVVETISHETVRTVLKKRTKALAKRGMVYSPKSQWRVCEPHGRCVGGVYPAVRPASAPNLYG